MKKSQTLSHAEMEFDILSKSYTDPSDRPIVEEFREEILALVNKFGNSGQSGGSAPLVSSAIADAVKKLCMQKPICPITGIDDEWFEFSDGQYQNNRLSSVFKDKNGKAYFLDAIVWKGDTEGESGNDWDTFTGTVWGNTSRQYIKSFPFTPKTFYVDVHRVPYDPDIHPTNESISCADGDYVYFIKDQNQLDEVYKYYNKFGFLKADE